MQKVTILVGKIVPLISFIMPISLLYYWDPASFEHTWQGRIFYFFFVWLIFLEMLLDWERLEVSFAVRRSFKRILLLLLIASAPTIYAIVFNNYGLNSTIAEVAKKYVRSCNPNFFNTCHFEYYVNILPVSVEFLVFTVLFCLVILLVYGIKDLTAFSCSIFFLGIMGILFILDDLYPGGKFVPLQMLVPVTAFFAARALELFGYKTNISEGYHLEYGRLSILSVNHLPLFGIGWICAGVESLVIYTIVIFLFLKKSNIATRRKLLYFVVGAVITYFINIMRVFTLAVILLSGNTKFFHDFHNFYGQFYSITWITVYPVMIFWIENLLKKRAKTGT